MLKPMKKEKYLRVNAIIFINSKYLPSTVDSPPDIETEQRQVNTEYHRSSLITP
jgi:hypothetical protein